MLRFQAFSEIAQQPIDPLAHYEPIDVRHRVGCMKNAVIV